MQKIGIESTLLKDIITGKKTVEGRLGKPKFLKLREGDVLRVREDVWIDGKITESIADRVTIEIEQVLYFESFKEMLDSLDFKQVIPSAKTPQEALDTYAKFYSKEDEIEYGVVAFEFSLY